MPRACYPRVCFCACAAVFLLADRSNAQTAWSGYTFSFTKNDGADWTLAANQDRITDNVWITRQDSQGIFNIRSEDFYTHGLSPAGTEWAFPNNNPGKTLMASDWAELTFDDWQTATGGRPSGPPETVGQNAVVHLITDDIYIDIMFTSWTSGAAGGGFSYVRAVAPPTGDYNGNGVVDVADYIVWRKTLNQPAVPAGSGADGDADGTIGPGDYEFWRARFSNTVPGAGSGAGATTVPEPTSAILLLTVLLAFHRRSR